MEDVQWSTPSQRSQPFQSILPEELRSAEFLTLRAIENVQMLLRYFPSSPCGTQKAFPSVSVFGHTAKSRLQTGALHTESTTLHEIILNHHQPSYDPIHEIHILCALLPTVSRISNSTMVALHIFSYTQAATPEAAGSCNDTGTMNALKRIKMLVLICLQ